MAPPLTCTVVSKDTELAKLDCVTPRVNVITNLVKQTCCNRIRGRCNLQRNHVLPGADGTKRGIHTNHLAETSKPLSRSPPLWPPSWCQFELSWNLVRLHESLTGKAAVQKGPKPWILAVHARAFLFLTFISARKEEGMQQLLTSCLLSTTLSVVAGRLLLRWVPCWDG